MIKLTELEVSILKYIENHGASTDNIYYEFKEEYDYIHCQELINGLIKKGYLRPDSDYYYITESGITYLYELGIEDKIESKETGYKESKGKLSYADLPWKAIEEIAKVDNWGKIKYPRGNSKKKHDYTKLWDAAFRHMKLAIQKEDFDHQSHEFHLAHAAWNILTLIECIKNNNINDDRI
jgi:hypothetical protein